MIREGSAGPHNDFGRAGTKCHFAKRSALDLSEAPCGGAKRVNGHHWSKREKGTPRNAAQVVLEHLLGYGEIGHQATRMGKRIDYLRGL